MVLQLFRDNVDGLAEIAVFSSLKRKAFIAVIIPVFIIVVVRHFFKKVVASEFLNFADLKIELCDLLL